jgi:hypothetical protein
MHCRSGWRSVKNRKHKIVTRGVPADSCGGIGRRFEALRAIIDNLASISHFPPGGAMDASIGGVFLQTVEIGLGFLETLQADSFEKGSLRRVRNRIRPFLVRSCGSSRR